MRILQPKTVALLLAPLTLALGLAVPALLPAGTAQAEDASQCGFIKNLDRRNYCMARAKRESSYCGFIKDLDTRNFCMAEVRGDSSYCGFIKDLDRRNECRAML